MENQSSPQFVNWPFRRIMLATLLLACIGLGFWLIYRFYIVFVILFVAIILGTVIRPIVNWLYKRTIPKAAGVILVYLFLLAFLIGFILLLLPLVFDQGSTIIKSIPAHYQNLRYGLLNSSNQLIRSFNQFLPLELPGFFTAIQTDTQQLASAEAALGYITIASKVAFFAIVILLLAFYWTLEEPKTIQTFVLMLPKAQRENITELIGTMESKIGYFIAGQGVLCLVIGVLAYIAYMSIGLPNALVLALVAGIFEAVPMIGPVLGAIPAGVIALSISPAKLLWVVGATIVIQQLENNLLLPRIMRKAVGVNPFVSLLAIFAFSSLFGVAGALMAIPIAAIIQLLLDRFVFNPAALDLEDSSGRDLISRLRYQAKDLTLDLQKQARIKKGGSDRKVKKIDKVMDEIEGIASDLDTLLTQIPTAGPHE